MQKLVKKSTDKQDTPWGLDWFVQAGHGGNGNRNCTLAEDATLATPAYPLVFTQDGTQLGPHDHLVEQHSGGAAEGHAVQRHLRGGQHAPARTCGAGSRSRNIQYPLLEYLSALKSKPLFIGVESVVAGHEHTSMSVITGQMPSSIFEQPLPTGPGYIAARQRDRAGQWEYCFDRNDADKSRGNTVVGGSVGNNWDCSVAAA